MLAIGTPPLQRGGTGARRVATHRTRLIDSRAPEVYVWSALRILRGVSLHAASSGVPKYRGQSLLWSQRWKDSRGAQTHLDRVPRPVRARSTRDLRAKPDSIQS